MFDSDDFRDILKLIAGFGTFILCIFCTVFAIYKLGKDNGIEQIQTQAIQSGVAKYIILSETNKQTRFVFITNNFNKLEK